MKILFATTIPRTLNAFFGPIAQELKKYGYEVHGVANSDGIIDPKGFIFDQTHVVDWTRGPLSLSNFLTAPKQLKKILMHGDYDIVHVSTPIAGYITRAVFSKLKNKLKTKLVYTAYGLHFFNEFGSVRNFVFSNIEKQVNSVADRMILSNKEDQIAIRKLGLMNEDNILYFPSAIGVDFDRFSNSLFTDEDVQKVKKKLDIPEDSTLFLSVAEFIPRKRQKDLLIAFSKLESKNAYLAFAGDGRLFDEMQGLARTLKIDDRTRFLGFRRDIPLLMKTADCLVLVSEREGIPMNLIEGLRMGTPFIGSNIRGTRQLIDEGCGIGIALGNISEITQAMQLVMDTPETLTTMSHQGFLKTTEFEFGNIFDMHYKLYESFA